MHRTRPLLLEQLRSATAEAHMALDQHPLLAPLVTPTLSVQQYSTALSALYGIHAALECALTNFAPKETFSPRLPALAKDLEELKARPFPFRIPLPPLDETAACIGAMYVLEGSRLGSRVIAKHLTKSLPGDITRAFFTVPVSPTHWQDFGRFATEQCPADSPLALATAREMFSVYRRHFDACMAESQKRPS